MCRQICGQVAALCRVAIAGAFAAVTVRTQPLPIPLAEAVQMGLGIGRRAWWKLAHWMQPRQL